MTQDPSDAKATKDLQLSVRGALRSRREGDKKDAEAELSDSVGHSDDDDEASFDARMRRQILNRHKELVNLPSKQKMQNDILKRQLEKCLKASPSWKM
ncbi:hypothetical protein Goarm_004819 [Gossypium armourianum]|uniref:Uncharacterized protein n=1 Tax=Gossypium armourianum TaxID=34283 RepID=A0A7J9JXY9_9ROSI|nr:hypothetical protein [Gossypium armourianum]